MKAGAGRDTRTEMLAITRGEVATVLTLLLLGATLRLAFPARMAIEHFDEGVYASNIWFGPELNYQYPMRHLYAPPLLPALVEASITAEQLARGTSTPPSSLALMAPSLLAGCLTLAAVWWTAREWFGPAAGIAALALAALNDFHAWMSRTALTDALLTFFVLMALWAWRRTLAASDVRWASLTGLLTGLAWWTKYNGWLPLAIGVSGLVIGFLWQPDFRPRWVRLTILWAIAAAVAFAVWSPYLWRVQSSGGYAAVAANHRQYVVGLTGWWTSLERQYASLASLDGAASSVAAAAALFGALSITARSERHRPRVSWSRSAAVIAMLFAASVWLGSCAVMLAIGAWFLITRFAASRSAASGPREDDRWACCLLLAWVAGLLFVTPLYYPYPRLTLPWLCGVWLAAGAGLEALTRRPLLRPQSISVEHRHAAWICAIGAAGIGLSGLPHGADGLFPAWQSRAAWRPVAARILELTRDRNIPRGLPQIETALFVYGEPGLFFQLKALGAPLVIPTNSLDFPRREEVGVPMYLIAGPHAQRTPDYQADYERQRARLEPIEKLAFHPSQLVLLDQFPPSRGSQTPPQEVWVYRIK